MSFLSDYFEKQRFYEEKYGSQTVVLMQKGAHYQIYEYNPKETQISLNEIQGNVPIYLFTKDTENEEDSPSLGKAVEVSFQIGLKLTSTDKSKPHSMDNPFMIGFPWAAYDDYREKLLMLGYTIVRVDEVGDDPSGKGKKREVMDITSPGTEFDQTMTHQPTGNNLLVSIYLEYQKGRNSFDRNIVVCGLSMINLTSGQNVVSETYSKPNDEDYALQEVYRFLTCHQPVEILIHLNHIPEDQIKSYPKHLEDYLELSKYCSVITHVNQIEPAFLRLEYQEEYLQKVFSNQTSNHQMIRQPGSSGSAGILNQLNLETFTYGRISYICLLQYCYEHRESLIQKLAHPQTDWTDEDTHLILTHNCIDQLDILPKQTGLMELRHRKVMDSLIKVVDNSSTQMGSRNLRKKLLNPITVPEVLESYYAMTQELIENSNLLITLQDELKKLPDIEKLQRKVQQGIIKPKELTSLLRGYQRIQQIYIRLFEFCFNESNHVPALQKIFMANEFTSDFNDCITSVWDQINVDLLEKVEYHSRGKTVKLYSDESFIQPGKDPTLDQLSQHLANYRQWLQNVCQQFNSVLRRNAKSVEISADRKGSKDSDSHGNLNVMLVTSPASANNVLRSCSSNEFYGNLESHKITAGITAIRSEHINTCTSGIEIFQERLEDQLLTKYEALVYEMGSRIFFEPLNRFICDLDFISTNARTAIKYKYYRPQLDMSQEKSYFSVEDLRHPLIERIIQTEYIPNDVELGKSHSGILQYGVNATGKTSLGKAIVLMIIMAQTGMFVAGKLIYRPYHKIITRLSGHDDIHKGQSSFQVEANEIKTILLNSGQNTLVIGDELCRGTESRSGTAITLAIIEKLVQNNVSFLFSTHMHNLAEMNIIQEMVQNHQLKIFHLSTHYSKELGQLVFDRKLMEGSGSPFYGLEVCKSLNLPSDFIQRAYDFCNQVTDKPETLVSTKTSRYSPKIYVDTCSLCGARPKLNTHHLRGQNEADEKGFIEHYHKNSSFNLLVLCEDCHRTIHQRKATFQKSHTLNGVYLNVVEENVVSSAH